MTAMPLQGLHQGFVRQMLDHQPQAFEVPKFFDFFPAE